MSDNVFSATPRRTPWNKGNTLRAASGNVHSADGWDGVPSRSLCAIRARSRADAGFANPEVYEFLEAEQIKYAIRLPANRVLRDRSATCSSAQWGDLPTGFIVTNLSRPADRVVASYNYNKRGAVCTFHQGCQEVLPQSLHSK